MLIILQGRLNSSRLPGKGLFNLFGQTIFERMCDIASEIKCAKKIVFATGDNPKNEILVELLKNKNVNIFFGKEDNVLDRFYQISMNENEEYITRITCDNYLAQPFFIEELFELIQKTHADYAFIEPLSHYSGEIFTKTALKEIYESKGFSKESIEHVTYDFRNSNKFKVASFPKDFYEVDHSSSVTLDTLDDLIFMQKIQKEMPQFRKIRSHNLLRKLK